MAGARGLRVVIVGAGLGGIAAAIEPRRHGLDELTILEEAPAPGGTWFYNRYPKCACDVPSHLYSFSFAQRREPGYMREYRQPSRGWTRANTSSRTRASESL